MKPILLDIMLNGRFVCQLRYTKRGFPKLVNGKWQECHDLHDIERFVYDKRPSLKGKNVKIAFSNQKVINSHVI